MTALSTTDRVLPHTWALTAGDLEKLCGQPTCLPPCEVLVDDVEGLCRGALADAQRRGLIARDVETGDWLEVLGFLLGEVVKRGRSFDPSKRGIEFRPWLYDQLRSFAVVDAQRWLYGRNGQHRLPGWSADERIRDRIGSDSSGRADAGEYTSAVDDSPHLVGRSRGAPPDPAESWLADLSGLHAGADSGDVGDVGDESRAARVGAAAGDRRPGARAGERTAGGPRGSAHWADCLICGWRTFPQAPNGKPGWHLPEDCTGCGAPLHAEAAA